MCGIFGVIEWTKRLDSKDGIKRATDSISHRGPDGEGQWISQCGHIGLGHRRLSIIDLSENAAQPMSYAQDRYTITFNGEIYNYIELKKELLKKGHTFKSNSDTEVLLAMYHQYKENMLDKLDGMFAFAIYDAKEKFMFCARDRFGEKPFFYSLTDTSFTFASEMKALWAYGVERKVDEVKRNDYINNGRVRTIGNTHETYFEDICSIDAGHYLTIDTEKNVRVERYWSLRDIKVKEITEKDATEKFSEIFASSINKRMRSDVAIGSSLSGGLDSSAIVSQFLSENTSIDKFSVFSARFDKFEKDEGSYIDELSSNYPRIQRNDVYPEKQDIMSLLEKAAYYHEEPVGSSSVLAQWRVYEKAKEKGVKVLLDGQGADEYLAGYIPIYNVYLNQLFHDTPRTYLREYEAFTLMHEGRFHQPKKEVDLLSKLLNSNWRYKCKRAINKTKPVKTLRNHLQLLSTETTIKELLRYADRNSMAHSREVRLPFLNHELVEFVHSLPDKYLLKDGWTKLILRQSMTDIIPSSICWRKDKVGYEPPQERWMNSSLVKEILIQQRKKFGLEEVKSVSYTNSQSWRLLSDYFI